MNKFLTMYLALVLTFAFQTRADTQTVGEKFKIFIVHSYSSNFEWDMDINDGIFAAETALEVFEGREFDYVIADIDLGRCRCWRRQT